MVIGYWLLVIDYWLLIIGYWLLIIGYSFLQFASLAARGTITSCADNR